MEQPNPYDSVLAFRAAFDNAGFDYPVDAAAYYVLYAATFNEITTFAALLDKARDLSRNISRKSLEKGRAELLSRGLMAQILFTHDQEAHEEFGREAYLPADPRIAWQDLSAELFGKVGSGLLSSMGRGVEQLSERYSSLFGEYGLAVEEGKLTLYYSGVWVYYMILGLCAKRSREVCLWLSGFRTSAQPLTERFRKILETGSTVRVIFDHRLDADSAKAIQAFYDGRVQIRFARVGTTRRMTLIGDAIALDGLRILPADMPAPGYIGTVYLDDYGITELSGMFEDKWRLETDEP